MNPQLIGLMRQYAATLRKHVRQGSRAMLRQGSRATLRQASRLGRQMAALGLDKLELARVHEQATANRALAFSNDEAMRRAEAFFAEALSPILETHRAARQNKIEFNRLSETLHRRTLELAATNRQLQRGIMRRKSMEAALKSSSEHYARLLRQSLQLQEGLRLLTHRALASEEEARKKISLELQNEVEQTLVGVNVRLLTLQQEARHNTKGLKKEIAGAQRLVVKSARSLRRVAREFRKS